MKSKRFRTVRRSRGFSVIEILVTFSLASILLAIALMNFHEMTNGALHGANQLTGLLKKARSKALASTQAITITPTSSTHVQATRGTTCSSTQTPDSELTLDLPTETRLGSTGWSICYTSRGLSQSSASIGVLDPTTSKTVQVVMGGGVRIL